MLGETVEESNGGLVADRAAWQLRERDRGAASPITHHGDGIRRDDLLELGLNASVKVGSVRGFGVQADVDARVPGGGIRQRLAQAGLSDGRRVDRTGGQQRGSKQHDEPGGCDERPVGTGPVQARAPARKE